MIENYVFGAKVVKRNKSRYQPNVEKLPILFIVVFICLIIGSFVIFQILFGNFADIEIKHLGTGTYYSEKFFTMFYEINNTKNLPIRNLKMYVTAKNQNNQIILDKEISIISELPRGKPISASFDIFYGNNDTSFDVDIKFKWNYFNSKSFQTTVWVYR